MKRFSHDGRSLAYDTAGSGPRVLLIQGVGVAGRAWAPQVEALEQDFELAWLDNRGIGASEDGPQQVEALAGDALALLDHLGWESAHVAGHSLGGVIAQQLALDARERVRSLALLCTFSRGRHVLSFHPAALWRQLRVRVGTDAMRRRAFFELVSPAALPATDENMRVLESAFGRPLQQLPPAAMAQVQALSRHDVFERLAELQGIPALVLSAQEDPIAPPREGLALAAALGVQADVLPGSHAITVQDASAVNRRLRRLWGER